MGKIAGVPEDEFLTLGEFFQRLKTGCQGRDLEDVARQVGHPRAHIERWLDERYAPHPVVRADVVKRLGGFQ